MFLCPLRPCLKMENLAACSSRWDAQSDAQLLAELQKLSAWLLDSMQGVDDQLGVFSNSTSQAEIKLRNLEAALTETAFHQPVLQVAVPSMSTGGKGQLVVRPRAHCLSTSKQ